MEPERTNDDHMLTDHAIPDPSRPRADDVAACLAGKAKPPGALGRLEEIAVRLGAAQDAAVPRAAPARLFIFAADHGLVAEGVSAWPREVTSTMVRAFVAGGAAASVLARRAGAEVTVVDAGVAADLTPGENLLHEKVGWGTANAAVEDAMTGEELETALRTGARLAAAAVRAGAKVIALGEMGIGNTASASLLTHALTGAALSAVTGRGAGLDDPGLAHKLSVLERCAARRPGPLDPRDALIAFGGFEIAMIAGAVIGAASARGIVLADGFISCAGVLAALLARPEAAPYVIFSHRSAEPGHRVILDRLDAEPLLDLGLRLGEGTGALLALPLLASATDIVTDMANLADLGITGVAAP
jgi:nicotinate-nucleotide--dimethylbenzimidazole phosphoribosyltransferase